MIHRPHKHQTPNPTHLLRLAEKEAQNCLKSTQTPGCHFSKTTQKSIAIPAERTFFSDWETLHRAGLV